MRKKRGLLIILLTYILLAIESWYNLFMGDSLIIIIFQIILQGYITLRIYDRFFPSDRQKRRRRFEELMAHMDIKDVEKW